MLAMNGHRSYHLHAATPLVPFMVPRIPAAHNYMQQRNQALKWKNGTRERLTLPKALETSNPT